MSRRYARRGLTVPLTDELLDLMRFGQVVERAMPGCTAACCAPCVEPSFWRGMSVAVPLSLVCWIVLAEVGLALWRWVG